MIRYLSWAAKQSTKVPRLTSESMIPSSKGKLAYRDLVRMYDLRMYHITTFPDNQRGDEYVPELEFLHNELNHRSSNSTFFRSLLYLGIAVAILKIFYEEDMEKYNWNNKWNLMHDKSLLATLDEGGSEGDDIDVI